MQFISVKPVNYRRLLSIALFTLALQPAAAQETSTAVPQRDTNHLRMLRGDNGPMTIVGNSQIPLADRVANQFAPQFGVRNPTAQLRVKKSHADNNRTHIRYQQLHQGLPVIGGELIANVDNQNRLMSMSGEISEVRNLDITPAISAEHASQIAITAVAKWYRLNKDQLLASTPELSIFDSTRIVTAPRSSQALAWQLKVSPNTIAPINEFVVIDAQLGGILFHFNTVDTALNRITYTADNNLVLPGSPICVEGDLCTPADDAAVDADIEAAHQYAADTYDFYFSTTGRDSIDGAGMTVRSTVHFPDPDNPTQPMENAFWLGADTFLGSSNQMVYGNGFSLADDVVGHELTHGVTDFTSNLFYYSESGAINESLSDLWGELIDQSNSTGNDSAGVRWLLGEDLPATVGIVRDMADPTTFSDPDSMTSDNFYIGTGDAGGVHINSGVNNKAVYLLVDGDTFNGQTVNGIGAVKTAKIYYEAQTNLLTSGSDYLDLYNALLQACSNLIGTDGIIAADCDEVQKALTAVEMNQAPSASYAPQATEICPGVVNVYDLFEDDFEANNLTKWTSANLSGSGGSWATSNLNLTANSGSYTMIGAGVSSRVDTVLSPNKTFRVPASTTLYIHFDQAFYFDTFDTTYYDGGLIEYSTDNGDTWIDANSLIESGRNYTGALSSFSSLAGRQGFVGYSNGYTSTRLDMTPLEGEFVQFRFRNATDSIASSAPWFIDNFRIYICGDNAPPEPNAGSDQIVNIGQNVQLTGTATDPDGDADIATIAWSQAAGDPVTLSSTSSLTPSFTARNTTDDLVFNLTVTDMAGNTETDTVTVNVGISLDGSGGNSGCSFSPNGRFDPLWTLLLLFFAGLHVHNQARSKHQ